MYLLDTMVVAELRKARGGGTDAGLATWAAGVPRHDLCLSALSLLELQNAAAEATRRDKARGAALSAWIGERVLPAFDGRVLAVDAAVVRRAGMLGYPDTRDALLVATALEHRLTLVTRHVSAYRVGRPRTFSPWGYVPAEDDGDWRQAAKGSGPWYKNLFLRA